MKFKSWGALIELLSPIKVRAFFWLMPLWFLIIFVSTTHFFDKEDGAGSLPAGRFRRVDLPCHDSVSPGSWQLHLISQLMCCLIGCRGITGQSISHPQGPPLICEELRRRNNHTVDVARKRSSTCREKKIMTWRFYHNAMSYSARQSLELVLSPLSRRMIIIVYIVVLTWVVNVLPLQLLSPHANDAGVVPSVCLSVVWMPACSSRS